MTAWNSKYKLWHSPHWNQISVYQSQWCTHGRNKCWALRAQSVKQHSEWMSAAVPCAPCRCWFLHHCRKLRRSPRCRGSYTRVAPAAPLWSGFWWPVWSPGESARTQETPYFYLQYIFGQICPSNLQSILCTKYLQRNFCALKTAMMSVEINLSEIVGRKTLCIVM